MTAGSGGGRRRFGARGAAAAGGPARGGRLWLDAMSGTFGFGYMLLAVLVPLYAHAEGYGPVTVGLLAAAPVPVQLVMRLLSGPLDDSWGNHPMFVLCGLCQALCGLVILGGHASLPALVVAQGLAGGSRGIFWVTGQSYATRLPGDSTASLGRFTGIINVGGLAGMGIGGLLTVSYGYIAGFAAVAAVSLVCLLSGVAMPVLPGGRHGTTFRSALTSLGGAFLRRPVWLAFGLAFLTAIPQALAQSFFPLEAVRLGGSAAVGTDVAALRSVGMVVTSLAGAWVIRRLSRRAAVGWSLVLEALALLAGAATGSEAVFAATVLLAGCATGITNLSFLGIATESSSAAERGSYMAAVNFFFATAMGVVPTGFGLLAAASGMPAAFAETGVLVLVAAAVWPLGERRLGPGHVSAASAPSAGAD